MGREAPPPLDGVARSPSQRFAAQSGGNAVDTSGEGGTVMRSTGAAAGSAFVSKPMNNGSHYIEFTAAVVTPPVTSTAGWRPTASALSSPVRTQRVVVVR